MRKLLSFFASLALVGLMLSCDSNDDYCFESQNSLPGSVTRGSDSMFLKSLKSPYYFRMDVYGRKYKTLLVLRDDGSPIGERGAFPLCETEKKDEDGNKIREVITDYTLYSFFLGVTSVIEYDDTGLYPSIDITDYDGTYIGGTVPIGDDVLIWASEEKYTIDDLRQHDGDVDYFDKVSKTFVCCYRVTLKKYGMVIDYDRIVENGWASY